MTSTTALDAFPHRTVHLDFHTGPDVEGVGAAFDPDAFARTFVEAGVDSVTVFAKCHHGRLYFGTADGSETDTGRPERHPGLAGDLDLLAQQVDALHAVGIRAPIYLSVQCDEYAADLHPDWIALDATGRQVKFGAGLPYEAGWQILDMSSPYQDFLVEQVQAVIDRFAPLDGLFLDMCWDQPSSSVWAKAGMTAAGLDPADADDRAEYARRVAHAYMGRFRDLVEPHLAADVASGVWFNSRPKTALAEESGFVRHIEIEALPSGGWGYSYFPYVSRFVRPLDKPTLSHTGRFYKSWGDNGGLKPRAALLYECSQILAQGMTGGVGDLLHPSGALNPVTYELIGSVYSHIAASEPFVRGGVPQADIAVIVDPALGDDPGAAGFGVVRALQQLRQQFVLVPPGADLSAAALVVVPETTVIDEALASVLRERIAAGGAVFVSRGARSGTAGLESLDVPGLSLEGASPFSHVFLRPRDGVAGTHGFDHVQYEPSLRMRAEAPAESLVDVVEPLFERTWDHFSGHEYTPPRREVSPWSALAVSGSVAVSSTAAFETFGAHGAPAFRDLVRAVLDRLLPEPLVRAGGPVHLESTVVETEEAVVVHLLSFVAARVATATAAHGPGQLGLDVVEDAFPLVDVPVSLRLPARPSAVHLQPEGRELEVDWSDGYATVRVSTTDGHAMLVATR
ncbi:MULTISPECIES: alpha-L-fucosidase [unclassified Rathayibacter]|uniref:alpha-L-fucosidase n=1 Tax=unclassified Rathayibacter TaxID=2609250 RepID=UPI000700AFD2|nr:MULTISPECIES: alpha-L-fucosidase [unclassified Rathayibacter]KQQ05451.1 hypothetical protein ASF42_02385 [Rathayibacter sp. Leaf294]KQS13314.1 hypothetical protein ASG06_02395 [Rathayibacter sp. Leaf185]